MMRSKTYRSLFLLGNHYADFPSINYFLVKTFKYLPKPILIQAYSNSFITINKNEYTFVDILSKIEIQNIIKKSQLIITHSGVGLSRECIKNNKKFILISRLPLWDEHCDFHQFEWFNLLQDLYPGILKINFVKLNNPEYCERIVKSTINSSDNFRPKILENYFNASMIENAVNSIIKRYH